MAVEVAVFSSHQKAVDALKALKEAGIPLKDISLLSKPNENNEDLTLENLTEPENVPLLVGAGAGTLVGLLTGLGAFAIPGFGFLYGAGAIIGAIAGFDLGVLTGGVVTLLATAGMDEDTAKKAEEHLHAGKFLIVVKGPMDEIKKAKDVLISVALHDSFIY